MLLSLSEFRLFKGGDRGRQLCGLELLKPIQGVKNDRMGKKSYYCVLLT